MLISAAAPGIGGQLHGRLSAPHANLSRIQVQLVREAHSKSGSVIIEATGRSAHVEAQFLGGHTNTLYRVIQRGNDGSFNPVLKTASRPEQPRSNHGGVIARHGG